MAPPTISKLLTAQDVCLEMLNNMLEGLRARTPESITREIASMRFASLNKAWNEAQNTHREIINRGLDALEPYHSTGVFRKIQNTNENLQDILAPLLTNNIVSESTSLPRVRRAEEPDDTCPAKIPRLDLPRFSGQLEDWPSFSDLFVSVVHENKRLTDTAPLQYLKSCVSGDAADALKDYKITNANYKTAWLALTERYTNPRLLIRGYLEEFRELKLSSANRGDAIRKYIEEAKRIRRVLSGMKLPIEQADFLVVDSLSARLDQETRKEWETELRAHDQTLIEATISSSDVIEITSYLPSFDKFSRFLEGYARTIQMSGPRKSIDRPKVAHPKTTVGSKRVLHTTERMVCVLCNDKHLVHRCPQFIAKNPRERLEIVRKLNLCFNCTGNHRGRDCQTRQRCKRCGEKHHTLLHGGRPNTKPAGGDATTSAVANGVPSASVKDARVHLARPTQGRATIAILPTAITHAEAPNGTTVHARVLLDQGSEVSFVSERLIRSLGLHPQPVTVPLCGIGSSSVGTAKGLVELSLRSPNNPSFKMKTSAYVLSTLTSHLPSRRVITLDLKFTRRMLLADPTFNQPNEVDAILGAEVYGTLLRPGLKRVPDTGLIAQNTAFGWVLSGTSSVHSSGRAASEAGGTVQALHCKSDEELCRILRLFWELEDDTAAPSRLKPEEALAEDAYRETHRRESSGRFVVRLPLRDDPPRVAAETRRMAMGSLRQIHRRFAQDKRLASAYAEFMTDYERLGHMERVPNHDLKNSRAWYIPHHAVVSNSPSDYKIRVVFDASRKTR